MVSTDVSQPICRYNTACLLKKNNTATLIRLSQSKEIEDGLGFDAGTVELLVLSRKFFPVSSACRNNKDSKSCGTPARPYLVHTLFLLTHELGESVSIQSSVSQCAIRHGNFDVGCYHLLLLHFHHVFLFTLFYTTGTVHWCVDVAQLYFFLPMLCGLDFSSCSTMIDLRELL